MFDDARRALRSSDPPEYHADQLDRFTATAWRYVMGGAALLALGALLEVTGLVG